MPLLNKLCAQLSIDIVTVWNKHLTVKIFSSEVFAIYNFNWKILQHFARLASIQFEI